MSRSDQIKLRFPSSHARLSCTAMALEPRVCCQHASFHTHDCEPSAVPLTVNVEGTQTSTAYASNGITSPPHSLPKCMYRDFSTHGIKERPSITSHSLSKPNCLSGALTQDCHAVAARQLERTNSACLPPRAGLPHDAGIRCTCFRSTEQNRRRGVVVLGIRGTSC